MSRRQHTLAGLTLVVALVIRFWFVWSSGFVYEDMRMMEQDVSISQFVPTWPGGLHRPLTRLSWWAQVQQGPRVMHLTNVGLHVLIGLLLVLLVQRLGANSGTTWAVLALYLLQPMATESVQYLTGRSELFMVIGIVGATVLLLDPRAWVRLYWFVGLFVGLAGKETAVIGLALCALIIAAMSRWNRWAVWHLMLCVAITCAVIYYAADLRGMAPKDGSWAMIQWTSFVHLTGLFLVPVQQAPEHGIEFVSQRWQTISMLMVTTMFLVALTVSRLRLGLLWMLIAMLPRVLVQPQIGSAYLVEHQYLLISIGAVLVVASVVRPEGIPSSVV